MATGGEDDSPSGELSLTTGSEAVFDHTCQPCSEGAINEAIGFCVDCNEWLCDECYRYHTRPRPTRNHVLKNIEEMEDYTPSYNRIDKCTEKCEQHDGKRIKYYCHAHDLLGCSMCIFQNHRTCEVQSIPDISKDIATNDELKNISARLEGVVSKSNLLVSDVSTKTEQVKMNQSDIVKAFKNYKKELVESLEEIEESLMGKCEDYKTTETSKIRQITGDCKAVELESLTIKKQLEMLERNGQYCDAFVSMKRSKRKVEILEDKLEEPYESSIATLYKFQPNLDVSKILHICKGIGNLGKKNVEPKKNHLTVQAHLLADIRVKARGNNSACIITGFALLPNHKLVLTDFSNSQVKVIDTHQNQMITEYSVNCKPRGLCKVSDDSVAVALRDKKQLLFLTIDNSGKPSSNNSIHLDGECSGVASTGDLLVVAFTSPEKLQIMTMEGSVVQTIAHTNSQGRKMLHFPQYVALSPDKTSMYVSNLSGNTVTRMGLDGTVSAIYKDGELTEPEQIVVDSSGMVYVGGKDSKNVHLLTPDCKKIKVLVSETDGLKKVYAVSYCEEDDRLYVGMYECDTIKVFQLPRCQ